ncbi:alpha/beta hydrolase [Lysinibacillus piscis]|uniref:Ferri-bacillibactin esterase BesA n=1 Tax=Lysinibacillus piscis TaxID=2518931 RepID=A0ABQ5NKK7_9BACI|nr:alpha/beta hydrolase-fold protein [Lysinibacillus sp. KH24]GLC88906.1 ferri-bacillibactin esterase BesA [Lysinibacillus sp. KH24]
MNTMTKIPYKQDHYFEYAMTSKQQLDYRILFASPVDEPPADGYAVIYALDGDALFSTLAEAVKLQTRKPKGFDPILVVGIGYPSKEPFDIERRCHDFTPPVSEQQLPSRPDGTPWPSNGHADDFLDFLEQELMPTVAKEWPINPAKQAIVGHSLGGLFTLYTLCTRPRLFSHIIAGSPSVWWGDNAILKKLDTFIETWQGEQPLHLLLTIGANELPDMLEGTDQVAEQIQQLLDKNLHTSYVKFSAEDHVSVLPCMLSRIPRFMQS